MPYKIRKPTKIMVRNFFWEIKMRAPYALYCRCMNFSRGYYYNAYTDEGYRSIMGKDRVSVLKLLLNLFLCKKSPMSTADWDKFYEKNCGI